MNKSIWIVIGISMPIISGLGQAASKEEVRTVEWYNSNKQERDAHLEKCRLNPGELALTANCINAKSAKNSSVWGATGAGIRPMEPIGLRERRSNGTNQINQTAQPN